MKYATTVAFLCALGCSAMAGAQEASWVGQFTLDGQATVIGLHQPADAPASMDVPAKGARGMPLKDFKFTARHAHFALQGGPDLYTFDGIRSATGIAGTVRQGARKGQFKLVQLQPAGAPLIRQLAGSYQIAPGRVIDMGPMDELGGQLAFLDSKTRRTGPLNGLSATRFVSGPSIGMPYPFAIQAEFIKDKHGAVTALRWTEGKQTLLAKKIAPHRAEEVTVVNGDVTLKGTLLLPLTPGPHPAIVFAHGSGPTTRNVGVWNSFFVRQGMAVLSLDKRGAGESSGDWGKASMATIADDWLAGVAMLKARADIDPKRIGVHGSSQGGWTGPLMAVKSNDVAYVIVRAGSANTVRDTMVHEIGWSVREAGFGEADAQEAQEGAGRLFDNAGLPWPQFNALAAPLKARPWANAAWAVHMSEEGWGRGWSVLNASYDPAPTLAQLTVPVLWFLGELDHNVPSAQTAAKLAAARQSSGNQDFTVVRLLNTGHAFLDTTTGNNSELPTLSTSAPGYWDKMESWLRERGFSQR
ncbi:S9 family peptidase [Massilia sp. CF038]|uniref:alpha/beta hydrolase family protein n=1 Tax=Massilia sp. CF038 TaxID=1881045 RepID=UPI00091F530C|nr:alpha/beta hydrolase [Massilia sp. CF038]SHG47376.1 X-Pro dipeptidyl-peptidase (S15 family) [Massilia sp. CF038]